MIGRDATEFPGGKGANQAVAAARLGANVAMVGRVGDDGFGDRLRTGLADEGIDVRHVATSNRCSSGLAIVAVDDSGENAITVIPGANGRVSPADVDAAAEVIAAADVLLLQLEVPVEAVLAAISVARRYGKLVILDPAPAPPSFPPGLLAVDVLCPNESEAAALAGFDVATAADAERAAVRLCKLGARHAIVTLGRQGALASGPDRQIVRIPGFAVTAVDTTAAGDAFAAALGVSLARGTEMTRAIQFACAAGALATSRAGAQPAMPTAAEVEQLLATGRVA